MKISQTKTSVVNTDQEQSVNCRVKCRNDTNINLFYAFSFNAEVEEKYFIDFNRHDVEIQRNDKS